MSPATPHHQVLKPRKTRCKTGCLVCRLRRKRCDEVRPECSKCRRLGLMCTWPTVPNEFAWRIRMGLNSGRENVEPTSRTIDESLARLANLSEKHWINLVLGPPSRLETSLDLTSHDLLRLYAQRTAPLITSLPDGQPMPLRDAVIPLAFSDKLIMNALLAMGGLPTISGQVEPLLDVKRLESYAEAVRELKQALTAHCLEPGQDPVRLLLVTMLLSIRETLCGNEGGTVFQHLRACRHFAHAVRDFADDKYSPELIGTLLETYAYYELCSSLRSLPTPQDIEAACELSSFHFESLRNFDTFGSFFGSATALYQMIPFVCRLAVERKRELATRHDLGCVKSFNTLQTLIENWDASHSPRSDQDDEVDAARFRMGIVVRNALLMFLYSSYHRGDVRQVQQLSQPLLEESLDMLQLVCRPPWVNTIFWPMVVNGSYAFTADQQRRFLAILRPGLSMVDRSIKMLQLVWHADDQVYGLDGLAIVAQEHKLNTLFG